MKIKIEFEVNEEHVWEFPYIFKRVEDSVRFHVMDLFNRPNKRMVGEGECKVLDKNGNSIGEIKIERSLSEKATELINNQ